MIMAKPGMCCGQCFGLIARRDTKAAKLWLDLCELRMHSPIFGLVMDDCPELRVLERLRFIVTTDTPEVIFVKVKGHQRDAIGSFFCGGDCDRP